MKYRKSRNQPASPARTMRREAAVRSMIAGLRVVPSSAVTGSKAASSSHAVLIATGLYLILALETAPPVKGLTLLQIWEAHEGALNAPDVWDVTWAALDSQIYVVHLYLSGRKVLFLPEGANLNRKARQLIAKDGLETVPYPVIRP